MSRIEKYPTMHPSENLIAQCLADPFNKTPGGKRRHPKYSLFQWRVESHCFDIERKGRWRRITVPKTDYAMRNMIMQLFRAYAAKAWFEGNNWRIKKYFDQLTWTNRRIRDIEYDIYIHLNRCGIPHTECEVCDAMYRYFTRCTNGQLLEREY